jgi:hypothetical protein
MPEAGPLAGSIFDCGLAGSWINQALLDVIDDGEKI